MKQQISYQTAWTFYTEEAGPISTSAFVMAASPKQAKEIAAQAIKNTYAHLISIEFLRPLKRVPCDRWPGRYITEISNLEVN